MLQIISAWKIWLIMILIIVFWLIVPKGNRQIVIKACDNFLQKCNLRNIAKFGFIAFSLVKLLISLYIISLMIVGAYPIYALILTFILFTVCAVILYILWNMSAKLQKGIFRLLATTICLVLLIGMGIIFVVMIKNNSPSIVLFNPSIIWQIIGFNIKYSFLSGLLIWLFIPPLLNYLKNLSFNDNKLKVFIRIFDFWYYLPSIIYALNVYFIFNYISSDNSKNFGLLAIIILSLGTYLLYVPRMVQKYIIDENCLSLFLLPQDFFSITHNKTNSLWKNISSFILLWGQIFLEIELILPFTLMMGMNYGVKKHMGLDMELYSFVYHKIVQILSLNNFIEGQQILPFVLTVIFILYWALFLIKKKVFN